MVYANLSQQPSQYIAIWRRDMASGYALLTTKTGNYVILALTLLEMLKNQSLALNGTKITTIRFIGERFSVRYSHPCLNFV